MEKRQIELLVLSDIHLGTYGCQAKELYYYLKSIQPKTVILNGDIIDIWLFSKKYWPASHMKVVKQILNYLADGCDVYYITGNHDEMLRKFSGLEIGKLKVVNKLELNLDGKKTWFFHGDVFDVTMKHSKWIAKLGAFGYDFLVLLNSFVNNALRFFGQERISFSKRIKNGVKGAVKFIDDFENTIADMAISQGYDNVVCGHIHQPEIKEIGNGDKAVKYLNSGDWIENLTALEYHEGEWKLFNYIEDKISKELFPEEPIQEESLHELFAAMVSSEFTKN